jgi:hypothetical protein
MAADRKTVPRESIRLSILLVCMAALLLLAGSCAKKQITKAPEAPGPETRREVSADAERAFREENWERAETLYRRLLDMPGLSAQEKAEAWQRLAGSALELEHYRIALDALENRALVDADVADDWQWHQTYLRVLRELDRHEQADFHLRTVVGEPRRPAEVRVKAGLALFRSAWERRDLESAMRTLDNVYALFDDAADKARFEEALSRDLSELDRETFGRLAELATLDNENRFPYLVIRLEQALRLAEDAGTWPRAWRILKRLSDKGEFAGPNLAEQALAELTKEQGLPGGGLALVLPLTGDFADVGWKIARGANAAQWSLLLSGEQVRVTVLNSESADLAESIAELPPEVGVIGGPLRSEVFRRLHEAGLTDSRAFFVFSSSLSGAEEGREAWRFFPGKEDEINALLDLAENRLNIRRLAVLHPEEPFGERLARTFYEQVERRNQAREQRLWVDAYEETDLGIKKTAGYPPGDVTAWSERVAEMLGVPEKAEDDEIYLPPEPDFEAVFIPDSWSRAELLVPHFFFHEEDRLLFLGPALWDHGVRRDKDVDWRYFRLSAYPAAFRPEAETPGAEKLRSALDDAGLGHADFWVALGFDFVRFASALGTVTSGFDPPALNGRIASAEAMPWSMAPMDWSDEGLASQKMFLLRPSRNGPVLVDDDRLFRRMVRARESHERRVMKLMREIEEKAREAGMENGTLSQGEPRFEEPFDPQDEEVRKRFRRLLESLEQQEQSEPQR